MSNPFATFRKNQKSWMAALVLLAILAFVVYPVFDYASRAIGGSSDGNQVVVRWNGGKITLGDLRNNVQKHSILVRFLGSLATEVIESGGQPQVPGFGYNPQTNQVTGLGIQSSNNEMDVCRTRILASHGKKLGIEFSDATVDEFITQFCDDRISTGRIEELLAESSGGRLSYYDVRELLKDELAALVVGQLARSGLYAHAPGKTFRDFMKLNQTVKIEAFPVLVDDYLDEVTANPSEAEIQSLYDIGATRVADPNSPEPGLIRRYQSNVEYVEANLQQWIDLEKEKLTEETLRAEYDRRVGLGQLQIPVEAANSTETDETTTVEDGSTAPGSSEETGASPENEPPAPNGSAPAEAGGGENPEGGLELPDVQTTEPANAEESGAETTPTSTGDPSTGDPSGDGDDQAAVRTGKTRLVAFVQEEQNPIPPPVVQPPPLGSEADASGSGAAVEEPKLRTQTFEEARDQIADSLAREIAILALEQVLSELLNDVMKPYFGAHRQFVAFKDSEVASGEEQEEPTRPDLKKLAGDRGLKYNSTGLIDGSKLAQLPFGLGNVPRDEQLGLGGSVANVVMNPSLELFRPMQSSYFDQAALMAGRNPEFLRYVFWKTEDREAYIPELMEVRDEVVDLWKRDQARQLADNAAQEIAKKVVGTDPWGAALNESEKALIVESEPFTWMQRFGEFSMTSNVPKLDAVGAEFMQKVFTASAGQVVVAANGARNVFYVCRIVEFGPAEDELHQRFNSDPLKSGPMSIASEESDRMVVDWYQSLETQMGVDWQMNLGLINN